MQLHKRQNNYFFTRYSLWLERYLDWIKIVFSPNIIHLSQLQILWVNFFLTLCQAVNKSYSKCERLGMMNSRHMKAQKFHSLMDFKSIGYIVSKSKGCLFLPSALSNNQYISFAFCGVVYSLCRKCLSSQFLWVIILWFFTATLKLTLSGRKHNWS